MVANVRVGVVGVGRNIEKTIEKEYQRYERVLSKFDFVGMYVVESDSDDKSGLVFEALQFKYKNFFFSRMGKLNDQYSERIDRIRICRNRYIQEIRTNEVFKNTDIILVVDLDNINSCLGRSTIIKAIQESRFNWSAIFPNQFFNYYDLIALRSSRWLMTDFNILVARAFSIFLANHKRRLYSRHLFFEIIRQKYMKRKCIHIPLRFYPIKVNSAFGGLGIYKTNLLLECDYGTSDFIPKFECEHVELHRQASAKGYQLYISPYLINNIVSKHTFRKSLICRLTVYYLRKAKIDV